MAADATSASTEQFQDVQCPVNGEPRDAAILLSIAVQPIVNCVRWLRARLEELGGAFLPLGALLPVALSVASSTFTVAGHGLSANDPVRFWSVGGSVPTPLAGFTTYYVVGGTLTSNTFQVSATSGGSAIALTSVGSGSIYAAKMGAASVAQLLAGLLSGNNVWTGTNAWSAAATHNGSATFNSTTVFNGNANLFAGPIARSGTAARYAKRAPVVVPDADTTIDTSEGDVFILTPATAGRTLTIRQITAPLPLIGEGIRLISPSGSAASWVVQREGGGSPMLTFGTGGTQQSADLEVRDSGGSTPHWTLGPYSFSGGFSSVGADAY